MGKFNRGHQQVCRASGCGHLYSVKRRRDKNNAAYFKPRPPESRLVVDEYLSWNQVRTSIRNSQILQRLDELVGRGIGRTQAVRMLAGEFCKAESTIWGLIP
jgi:hypothetical protein